MTRIYTNLHEFCRLWDNALKEGVLEQEVRKVTKVDLVSDSSWQGFVASLSVSFLCCVKLFLFA